MGEQKVNWDTVISSFKLIACRKVLLAFQRTRKVKSMGWSNVSLVAFFKYGQKKTRF